MTRARLIVALVFVVLHGSACGYVASGTWDDDPDNWARAFQSEKARDVLVLHSRYWRSAHWSYEFQYFFEIRQNADFRREMFARNRLRPLGAREVEEAKRDPFGRAPGWFCPKAAEKYDAWVYKDAAQGNFTVLIDKESGNLYLTDFQV